MSFLVLIAIFGCGHGRSPQHSSASFRNAQIRLGLFSTRKTSILNLKVMLRRGRVTLNDLSRVAGELAQLITPSPHMIS